ncbi:MAG TPA: SPFH domain-containing protein, partial [Nitrososphaeraceae archaeon]|nr:SPFH domain-containing protein [Nitrososphaeraceae archaeon]
SDIKSLKTYTQNSIQAFNDMNHINIINSGKDTLGGFPAHQINYTSTAIPGLDLKKMQIFTVIDNMAYVVTFGAEQAEFYKNIQDVENLINSIKIENSLTHLASVDKPVEPLIPDKVNIEHANPLVALDFIFDNYLSFGIAAVIIIALIIFFGGLRMVRPTHRAAIERLSRYHRFMKSGITWIIPIIDRIYPVNITEQMADADQQEIITKDNLNAFVDVQIYFKVKEDEESVKAALYNVNDYRLQIISLARTTLRNVIGNKEFSQVNNNRTELNKEILGSIQQQTANWGLEIVRCELKEIQPPADVQQTMNTVLKAQNEKQAAIDFATARETAADGEKRAAIKQAEGQMQSAVLKAQGEAQAILKVAEARSKEIQIINEAAQKYFVGNAQILKQLEVNETAMKDNTKFVIAEKGTNPVIVFGQDGVPTNNVIVTKPKDKYPSDIS